MLITIQELDSDEDIVMAHWSSVPIQHIYAQITQLFHESPDLLHDFKLFLPVSAAQPGLLRHSVQHLPTTMTLRWIRNIMKMNLRTIAKKWQMNSRVVKKVGTVIAPQSSDGTGFSVPIVATVPAGDEGSGRGL